MSTIIDGRGNLHRNESETILSLLENKKIKPEKDEIETMSIEEYRNLQLTPEQEWNNIYNPKRVSIEASKAIEIRKRGKGPDKKIFYPGCKEAGPYYDPSCNHVHVWKKRELIKNFIGEQFSNVPHVQFTDDKPGLYCSICHARNNQFHLKWHSSIDDHQETPAILHNTVVYKKEDHLPPEKIKVFPPTTPMFTPVSEPDINNRVLLNWKSIMSKVNHCIYNDKIIYPVSRFKSLYLWPWQLTPYQKFKLNVPDYKTSKIFLANDNLKFQDNYAVIV